MQAKKPHHIINYQLIRSARKSLGLQVKNAQLFVKAPLNMPLREIDNFINKKQQWIHKHLHNQAHQSRQKLTFQGGDKFWYLGTQYPLQLSDEELHFNGEKFIGRASVEDFLWLYKINFANILNARLPELAQKHHFKYNQVRIKAQKTRWGSCSGQDNLNFNYLLMSAPPKTIDSVIIHELCHTIHKNHSANFWKLVYTIMPDYKIHQQFLKDNNGYLSLFLQ